MISFREIFESVNSGNADFGVIPLENSLAGSVHENYDLLLEYEFKIIGEITLRIKHNLIGHPGTKIEDIKRVHSHPQVFRQCQQFLERHPKWEHVFVTDTARGVKQIKESGNKADAALAGKDASEVYSMEVLVEGVETNPRNFTRFVIISARPLANGEKKKSSLVYSTGNQPGALFETLKIFADNGVNLVKLESRPIHGKPWEYMFYIDMEGDVESETLAPVLKQLKAKTDYLKVLGSY
jgi:prephenate dehydratase